MHGIAVAALGMISTITTGLAIDAYGVMVPLMIMPEVLQKWLVQDMRYEKEQVLWMLQETPQLQQAR